MTDRARDAVTRMRRTLNDCATFDRQAVGNDFLADITQKSRVHDYTAACIDAGRELPAVLSAADRYRLAWMSARQRAANHFDALVDSDDQRDQQEEVLELIKQERDEARRRFEELAARGDAQGQQALTLRRERNEAREQVEYLKLREADHDALGRSLIAERDEARAEVVRLGRENEEHLRTIRSLNAHREADV